MGSVECCSDVFVTPPLQAVRSKHTWVYLLSYHYYRLQIRDLHSKLLHITYATRNRSFENSLATFSSFGLLVWALSYSPMNLT